ncbi:MAG: hypothetical protein WAO33_08665, partial [Candidatus Nanopelagicales bacterium]
SSSTNPAPMATPQKQSVPRILLITLNHNPHVPKKIEPPVVSLGGYLLPENLSHEHDPDGEIAWFVRVTQESITP